MNHGFFMSLAAGAGICIAFQAAANGKFRQNINEPLWAAFLSICGTFLCACITMLITRPNVPESDAFKTTQWWNWIGGPLGCLIVLSGTLLISQLGAARFLAFVIGGQLLASLLLDHFGLMGLKPDPVTTGRLLGVLLIVAGVVLVKFS
jgi:transporter family-2 protein